MTLAIPESLNNTLRVLRFPPPIKPACNYITEILQKITLNTLTLTMFNNS